jgi:hypothetical protein
MTMRKEIRFSIHELRHVSITCPQCATDVTLDMANYKRTISGNPGARNAFAPRACPACKTAYDTALVALDDLQQAYALLSKLEGVVAFRLAED